MDALILEANLIKEHRPRFNVILKDDKSHLYIKITLYENWPRISTCRATDIYLDPKATYFGPFPSGRTVKETLRSLRRVFPYLAHNQPAVAGRRRPPQSYFYYNLPLQSSYHEPDLKEYRRQVFQLIYFLEGKRQTVTNELEKLMNQASKDLDFEQAGNIKRQLDGMSYITQKTISPDSYISNPELLIEKRLQGLRELSHVLSGYWKRFSQSNNDEATLDSHPLISRIECFDISNISGQYAVGSMVVCVNGEMSKSDYRKFRVKREQAPNDVAMMAEILRRRFKRLQYKEHNAEKDRNSDSSFNATPDLIIVDGGKGQLSMAYTVLAEFGLDIPIVGMTKREEELLIPLLSPQPSSMLMSGKEMLDYTSSNDRPRRTQSPKRSAAHGAIARNEHESLTNISTDSHYISIRLARGSEALFLIQRIRDEAHRFAITYHRNLRAKGFLGKS
jgi:excinuclease ABC subunit C